MIVIPAIDLLDGKVVRLRKGSYEDVTVYNDDPLNEAKKFKNAGFNRIHVVDLNGAKEGTFINLEHIEKIKKVTALSVQAGGGIRSYKDATQLLEAGIDQIVCSSMAVKNKPEWMQLLSEFPEKMILAMDLKNGKIAYNGWLKTSDESINTFLQPMIAQGLKYVLCTDISRDGTLQGANVALYQSLQKKFPSLSFIASGGVSCGNDLQKLQRASLFGVVVGRAYYERKLTLREMQKYHD